MANARVNPAERAAQEALDSVYRCLDSGSSFRFEAGAGSGKTYALIKALEYLIEHRAATLLRQNQQIACITYTNVACDEIKERIDSHPAVHVSTIHAFCWLIIKDFQPYLQRELQNLNDKWLKMLEEVGGIGSRAVAYETGYRTIEENIVTLHHDDVLLFTVKLMEQPKFRAILIGRYPVLLIDEYQDTDIVIAEALKKNFFDVDSDLLIGLFGDHWQKIYGTGCGMIEHSDLSVINQGANFRSVWVIVQCLNRIREELPQQVKDPEASGFVGVYHTNSWTGLRRTGAHWNGDLPSDTAHEYLETLKEHLATQGWNFSPDKTKILMLTHRVLAAEQNYNGIVAVFSNNEAYIQKQDPYIAFFADKLEPTCIAYQEKRFGEMFSILGSRTPAIRALDDKKSWARSMATLLELRSEKTVGAVLDHLRQSKRPRLPDEVEKRERNLEEFVQTEGMEEPRSIKRSRELREVPYREIVSLTRFINEETPFSTKHGVKGAEYENVLVVFGRGWSQYNFNKFLEWAGSPNTIPSNRQDMFERNRNLFYVTCSRPKKRLALLFTQKLSAQSIATLERWFGAEAVQPLDIGN
jgi:DNA helicase-2/ATP-dependent DNA helicase PcrA